MFIGLSLPSQPSKRSPPLPFPESFPSKRGAAGLWRRPRRPGSAPRRPGADLHDGRADPGLRKDVLRLRPPFALRHEATAGTSHSAPPERRAPSHRAAQ